MLKNSSHSKNILFFLSLFIINNAISAIEPLTTVTIINQSAAAAKALFILASNIASGTIPSTVPTVGQAGVLGLTMLTGMYAMANYPSGNYARPQRTIQQAEQKEFVLPRNVREHLGLLPHTQEHNLPGKTHAVVSEQPTETANVKEKKSVLEEKSLQEKESTQLQEGTEGDQEDKEKKKKHYALMGALVRSEFSTGHSDQHTSNFQLPGEKIPVSNIPAVKGTITGAGNQMLVSDVDIPGFGHGNFIMEIHNNTPIALANHQGYQQPVVYPPSEKGQLLRLKNVTIPNVGNGDLILFVPHALLEEASAEHACQTLAAEQKTSAAKNAQVILADKIHGKLDSKIAPALGFGAVLATGGIAELSLAGSGIILTGPICVPIIAGGTAVYVIIRVGKLFGVWRQDRKAAREQEFSKQLWEACQQKVASHFQEQVYNACNNELPQEAPKQCGSGSIKTSEPDPKSCGHTTPPMPEPAGCGYSEPKNMKPVEGAPCEQGGQNQNLVAECNTAQSSQMPPISGEPSSIPDLLISAMISEHDVKAKLAKIITDVVVNGVTYEVNPPSQKLLDHTNSGHTDGGSRVYTRTPPRTVFIEKNDMFDIYIETLGKGVIKPDGPDHFVVEHEFGYPIGRMHDGTTVSKVRVILKNINNDGSLDYITMYPIEV